MRYSTLKLLSATTIALLCPFIPLDALPIPSSPAFAQIDPAARLAEADRLLQQGVEQFSTSRQREAIQSWQQALEIYREPGIRAAFPQESRQREGAALGNLGEAYRSLGQYQWAIDFYEQSLAIAREIGNRQGEETALGHLGVTYSNLEQYAEAIEFHEQSLNIARELDNQRAEETALGRLGSVYANLGRHRQAIDYHKQRLAIARELGDQRVEGNALGDLGLAYDNLGQHREAIDFYEQSLRIVRALGNLREEGNALGGLGSAYRSLGQYQTAISFYEQSLNIFRQIGNRQGEGSILSSLGNTYDDLGHYRTAINFYEQSLDITREIGGNRQREGVALNGLGNTYSNLGQYQTAISFYEQSLNIFRQTGNRQGEGVALNSLGAAHFNMGQIQAAIGFYEESLGIARELNNLPDEGNALSNLGETYRSLGQYQAAIDFQKQSLDIFRQVGNQLAEGSVLNNLGISHHNLGQYREAIDFYEQSLAIDREIGDRQGEGGTLNNLGAAYSALGQFSLSTDALLESIAVYESLRAADLPDAEKISFFDTYLGTYLSLQRSLIAQNDIEQALAYAEQGRARALVDSLATRLASNADPDAPLLGSIPTPTLAEIKQIATEQNATLVKYSVIFNEALYIWVIQPNGNIAFRSIPLDEASQGQLAGAVDVALSGEGVFRGDDSALSNLVADVRPGNRSTTRDVVEEPIDGALADTRLRELHQLLIEPIQEYLPTNETDRIIFIPHSGLFLVPFAALQDDEGNYLIENHTISIAPSIQVLDLARQQRQQANGNLSSQDVLIVGNPVMPTIWNVADNTEQPLSALPGAETEALEIANFFDTTALIGATATETSIVDLMPSARIIHLATHGLLEYGIPQDSGVLDVPGAIALAPSESDDGLLTSAELLEMNLQAELVVLSACDTGRGRITGDGVIGLSRSLFSAGVPSVVVSLWSVPDAPTADLMVEFYRQLETTPDKAQALRQAMLITMQDHPDPIDWAGFTLIGEAL